jgi:MFS family permease
LPVCHPEPAKDLCILPALFKLHRSFAANDAAQDDKLIRCLRRIPAEKFYCPMSQRRIVRWIFLAGVLLNLGGVLLCALLEIHSFHNTQDWQFAMLETIFMPALLAGTVLVIVGSVVDRRGLPVARARTRGWFCLAASVLSFVLLALVGNVHSWTFTFIFPAFAGLVAAGVFLSKPADVKTSEDRTGSS